MRINEKPHASIFVERFKSKFIIARLPLCKDFTVYVDTFSRGCSEEDSEIYDLRNGSLAQILFDTFEHLSRYDNVRIDWR